MICDSLVTLEHLFVCWVEVEEYFLEFLGYYEKHIIREHLSEIRQHAMWFVKGVRHNAILKKQLSNIPDIDGLKSVFENFE